jgi:hypothetical protein
MKKPDHRQERFRLALTANGVTILLLGLVPSVRKAAPHVKVRLTPTLRGVMPKSTMLDSFWRGRRGLSRSTISAER